MHSECYVRIFLTAHLNFQFDSANKLTPHYLKFGQTFFTDQYINFTTIFLKYRERARLSSSFTFTNWVDRQRNCLLFIRNYLVGSKPIIFTGTLLQPCKDEFLKIWLLRRRCNGMKFFSSLLVSAFFLNPIIVYSDTVWKPLSYRFSSIIKLLCRLMPPRFETSRMYVVRTLFSSYVVWRLNCTVTYRRLQDEFSCALFYNNFLVSSLLIMITAYSKKRKTRNLDCDSSSTLLALWTEKGTRLELKICIPLYFRAHHKVFECYIEKNSCLDCFEKHSQGDEYKQTRSQVRRPRPRINRCLHSHTVVNKNKARPIL